MTTQSVLSYLERSEAHEQNPDYADAIRIAWITTNLAYQDQPLPFLQAFYTVYGIHPDNLMEKLKQRRLSQLERWYEAFWGELPPKKPVQSILPLQLQSAVGTIHLAARRSKDGQ